MNRKELVDAIQKHTEVPRGEVDKVLGSLIQVTQVTVRKGDRVSLVGFGTFERRDRKARTARNPRTGTAVKVKATKIPVFRAGQGFKDIVSGKAAAPKLTAAKPATRANSSRAQAKTVTAKASTAKTATKAKAAAPARRTTATAKKAPARASAGRK